MPTPSAERYLNRPLLDIASYAKRGPGTWDLLSPAEIEHIRRTVQRTPEVMVKVLGHRGKDMKAVGKHFDYLSRKGELEIETDDGQILTGKGVEKSLMEDWDLDLDELRRGLELAPRPRKTDPRLVHKIVFSMPPGSPPDKVFAAVRNFAREEFGLQHRYAMVLHTDEPHPHVHVVVKAMSEQGKRLNIRKATLRGWRQGFAAQMRREGVEANATERAVRGLSNTRKLDGIFRAGQRGYSSHMADRVRSVAGQILEGKIAIDPGKDAVRGTRKQVTEGWLALAGMLEGDGLRSLAYDVRRFHRGLPGAGTERDEIVSAFARPTELDRANRLWADSQQSRHTRNGIDEELSR